MKLGKRLQQLENMVGAGYDHVWDCCCDHGLLGAALLSRNAAPCIHFVDLVPGIVCELEQKLARFFPLSEATASPQNDTHKNIVTARWQTHCIDLADLPLAQYRGKHLLIIAGVGGDLMADLVSKICTRHTSLALDFLLCPVHHQFHLRQTLIALNCVLQHEILLEENQRYYEVLLVSAQAQANTTNNNISPVGNQLWSSSTPEQERIAARYLEKTLAHYERMQRQPTAKVEHIIASYKAVTLWNTKL